MSAIESGSSKKEKDLNAKNNIKQNRDKSDYLTCKNTNVFAVQGLLARNLDHKICMAFERLASQIGSLT